MVHSHRHTNKNVNSRAFAIGIGLNVGFVAVEIFYGLMANSSALLADAGVESLHDLHIWAMSTTEVRR